MNKNHFTLFVKKLKILCWEKARKMIKLSSTSTVNTSINLSILIIFLSHRMRFCLHSTLCRLHQCACQYLLENQNFLSLPLTHFSVSKKFLKLAVKKVV